MGCRARDGSLSVRELMKMMIRYIYIGHKCYSVFSFMD